MSPRILTLDIETAPSLAYVWRLHDENVSLSQLLDASEVICFAAKWLDEAKVEFRSVYHDGRTAMIERAHALLDEADAVIGYNSRAFDVKHLRREFVLAGLTPPSPHSDIDLWSVVRKQFKFVSTKLDHVATELGIGSKVQHTGFQLWRDAIAGDDEAKAKAWRLMRRYNIGDVRLTEALYLRLLPWIHSHPNPALYGDVDGIVDNCQRCGGFDLERRGFAFTTLGKFQRYRCHTCGSWSRGAKRIAGVDARSI